MYRLSAVPGAPVAPPLVTVVVVLALAVVVAAVLEGEVAAVVEESELIVKLEKVIGVGRGTVQLSGALQPAEPPSKKVVSLDVQNCKARPIPSCKGTVKR